MIDADPRRQRETPCLAKAGWAGELAFGRLLVGECFPAPGLSVTAGSLLGGTPVLARRVSLAAWCCVKYDRGAVSDRVTVGLSTEVWWAMRCGLPNLGSSKNCVLPFEVGFAEPTRR